MFLYCIFQRIRSLVSSDKVRQVDKLRLVMLYALRYESHSNNDLSGLVEALRRCGVAEEFRGVSFCLYSLRDNSPDFCSGAEPRRDQEEGGGAGFSAGWIVLLLSCSSTVTSRTLCLCSTEVLKQQ